MRPWFTLVVVCLIALSLLVFLFVVDFVLINRTMFEQSFNIQLRFLWWSHTWVEVQFMYIIAASILIGALVIAITTLGLDTQRTLKLRSMRKELKRLQSALQEAQTTLQSVSPPIEEQVRPEIVSEPVERPEMTSPTPEMVVKSFEDAVQKPVGGEAGEQQPEAEQPAAEMIVQEDTVAVQPNALSKENVEYNTTESTQDVQGAVQRKTEEQTPLDAEVVEGQNNQTDKSAEDAPNA